MAEEDKISWKSIKESAQTMREVITQFDALADAGTDKPITPEQLATINEFITIYKSNSLSLFRAAGGWEEESEELSALGTAEERKAKIEEILKEYKFDPVTILDPVLESGEKVPLMPDPEVGGVEENNKFGKFLQESFAKHNFAKIPENIKIPENQTRWDQLYSTLLKNNPGLAFADVHNSRGIASHITSDLTMKVLADNGVTRLYYEGPQSLNEDFSRYYKSGKESDFKLIEEKINASEMENKDLVLVGIKNARKHGIEFRAFDNESTNPGNLTYRTGVNNFNFTNFVTEDSKTLKPGEKYVKWEGIAHLGNTLMSNGMVDEGLGIPTVGYVKSDAKSDGKFNRENGVLFDFTVNLGNRGVSREEYNSYLDQPSVPAADLPVKSSLNDVSRK